MSQRYIKNPELPKEFWRFFCYVYDCYMQGAVLHEVRPYKRTHDYCFFSIIHLVLQ